MEMNSVVMEDCIKGSNDWRNIQSIIRTTFGGMNECLRTQKQQIQQLQTQVQQLQSEIKKVKDMDFVQRKEMNHFQFQTDQIPGWTEVLMQAQTLPSSIQQLQSAQTHDQNALRSEMKAIESRLIEQQQHFAYEAAEKFATKNQLLERAEIGDVNESLRHKANKDTIDSALQQKVSREELKDLELRLIASQKNNISTQVRKTLFDYISSTRSTDDPENLGLNPDTEKPGSFNINSVWNLVEKQKKTTNHHLKRELEEKVAAIQEDSRREVEQQALRWEDQLRSSIAEVTSILRQKAMASDVQLLLASKVDRQEVLDLIKNKGSRADMERAIEQNTSSVALEVQQIAAALKQELVVVINKKAYKSDVIRSLQTKADAEEMRKALLSKVTNEDVQEACRRAVDAANESLSDFQVEIESEVENLRHELNRRAISTETRAELSQLKNELQELGEYKEAIEEIRKEVLLKVGIKDACTLLDMKSNTTDVNEALESIYKALDTKCAITEMTKLNTEYTTFRKQLRSETCIGRWIWKTGCPRSTRTISWNVQAVNTNPEVFVWEQNSDLITAVLPGLYQVNVAFFTDRAPTIQVLVNGEPAYIACETANAKLKALRRVRHSAGNISGITISEYLALPPRAQIAVSYDIDEKAQGFLALRKL